MLTEDYVMRMLNQALAVLLKIAGFKQAGQYKQAQQAIDQELEELLGLKADLVWRLDDEAMLRALTINDQLDVVRLEIISDLFREQGEITAAQGRVDESRECFRRALMGYLEVGLASESKESNVPLNQKIDGLLQTLGQTYLSDDTVWALFCYADQNGDFNEAERALADLAERLGVLADLRPEIIAFYERLLALPPDELSHRGLDRVQLEQKLASVRDA
jgi:tetratricopeptide (TPR) repeat protein